MTKKKICMLGSFAVGKTSMVARWLDNTFSDQYLTTVGVKIGKKIVAVGGEELTLMLWDLAGEDEFSHVEMSYLRGASGYLLVVDGSRRETLQTAIELQARVETAVGTVPFAMVFNKLDLQDDWEIQEADITAVEARGWPTARVSAKTGVGVPDVFSGLAARMTAR